MNNKKIVTAVAAIAILTALGFGVYKIFGDTALYPFLYFMKGNSEEYRLENVNALKDSPVKGKKVLFLGSSVTKGYGSCGVSFADYLGKKYELSVYKEAVSGTTLVTQDESSYIPRLKNVSTKEKYDAVVCQLSTNDATKGLPLGKIGTYDESTVVGAIEVIIRYCRDTWNCPVIFYTGTRYDSEAYGAMVKALYEVQGEWSIEIIDLWNDGALNEISQEKRSLYMLDDIHPTMAGYLEWWLPPMEKIILETLSDKKAEKMSYFY